MLKSFKWRYGVEFSRSWSLQRGIALYFFMIYIVVLSIEQSIQHQIIIRFVSYELERAIA
jgi:hypothetical protein